MFNDILKKLQDTGDLVMDKASEFNDAAKDKMLNVIEDWVAIIPTLEALGFKLTSFGISMSISPCLLAELHGKTEDFTIERITKLIQENKDEKALKFLLGVIKTTLQMHARTRIAPKNDLIVRMEVKLSPEIKVFIGRPELL